MSIGGYGTECLREKAEGVQVVVPITHNEKTVRRHAPSGKDSLQSYALVEASVSEA